MVYNIIGKINLSNTWQLVDIKDKNDFYLIGIKGSKQYKDDAVASSDVTKVTFKVGVDSGVKGKPIVLGNISLDFSETTSDDEDFDKISAFKKVMNYPSQFYIKPISFTTSEKTYTEGQVNISINVNALDLG